MARYKNKNLQSLERFIAKKLRHRLLADLKNLRLIKEADLECATYFHLRNFLGKDPQWKVLARKYVKSTGRYPDLLVYRRDKPVLAFELKWNKSTIGKKDRNSLSAAIKKLKLRKIYWLAAWYKDGTIQRKESKNMKERYPYRYKEIFITHGLSGEDFENYKKDRSILSQQRRALG